MNSGRLLEEGSFYGLNVCLFSWYGRLPHMQKGAAIFRPAGSLGNGLDYNYSVRFYKTRNFFATTLIS